MFYKFNEIRDNSELRKIVGKKTGSLLDLSGWGFNVPFGGCITTAGFEEFLSYNKITDFRSTVQENIENKDQQLIESAEIFQDLLHQSSIPPRLREKVEQFLSDRDCCKFAVRSSGTKEDLGEASFAGQYTTVLNVGPEDIFDAVKSCWASLFNKRVINYCKNNNICFSDMNIAVIIQEMVPAEKSGVIFSVNSLSGADKEVIIEACYGLGEALVGGEVNPDHYRYNWFTGTETKRTLGDKKISVIPCDKPPFVKRIETPNKKQEEYVLSIEEVKELADIAVHLQAKYGFPIDIEWAKKDDTFYILQSRPITKISYSGIPGEWTTADFKDGGVSSTVCSQFMWSLYEMVWESTMPFYIEKIKLGKRKKDIRWGDMFFGRPYWNVYEVKERLKGLPGYVERTFDEELGIKVCYEGDGHVTGTNLRSIWTGLKVLFALNKSVREQNQVCAPFKRQQKKRLDELDKLNPLSMDRREFFEFYENFIKVEYYLSESTYFFLIFNNSNYSSLFMDNYNKIKGELNYLNLISGLLNLSHLVPNYRLWEIKNKIKEDAASYSFWKEKSIDEILYAFKNENGYYCMDDVRMYVEDFKYHSTRELDITVPRYGEDPGVVIKLVKSHLDLDDSHNPVELNKKQYRAYEVEREKFLRAVPFYKRKKMTGMLDQMRKFLWWREELRDYSTRYYYHVRRFTLVLADHFVEMGIITESSDIFYLPVSDIFDILHGKISSEESLNIVKRNKLYYNSFRNFVNPNEIGSKYLAGSSTMKAGNGKMCGIACSPGVVTGRVKVIKDIFDAERLEEGDILITRYTDPGWTPEFSLLSGVATETGGVLSHAAVISREYGIPAVLAVDNITQLLKDEQVVTIDGNRGEVIPA